MSDLADGMAWEHGSTTGFPKHALEFYVQPVTMPPDDPRVRAAFDTQQCPILGSKCLKNRKSEAQQSIGSCIVGFQGRPLLICPIRLRRSQRVFQEAVHLIDGYEAGMDVVAIPEIGDTRGTVDYVLTAFDGDEYVDHVGIEFQTLDTTGSVWPSRQDYLDGTLAAGYGYGMNWRMNAKTILVQLHHKAPMFAEHGKKLLLVVQDAFMEKMRADFDFSDFRPASTDDVLHVHSYRARYASAPQPAFRLELAERVSTDLVGVEKALAAVVGGRMPTLDEYAEKLTRKRERGQAISLDQMVAGGQPIIAEAEIAGSDEA